jgi:hypothetical protein
MEQLASTNEDGRQIDNTIRQAKLNKEKMAGELICINCGMETGSFFENV